MKPTTSNNVINTIKEARKLFNEIRSYLSNKETKRIKKKLHKKEIVYNFLKENEQEGSLVNKQKKALKNICRYPKNIVKHLKNFKKHIKKLQKYQYILDYSFNERNEEDHITEPAAVNNGINAMKDVRKFFKACVRYFL